MMSGSGLAENLSEHNVARTPSAGRRYRTRLHVVVIESQRLEERQRVHRQLQLVDQPVAAASIRCFAPPVPLGSEIRIAVALLRFPETTDRDRPAAASA